MARERMLNGGKQPTEREILRTVGKKAALWSSLREYLADQYPHEPQLAFWGANFGWTIRYRKSGKTLIALFPEENSFTALVVLGRKEVAKAEDLLDRLSKRVRDLFLNTEQLRDGRWLWIRPSTKADVMSIQLLLATKRKPKGTDPKAGS